MLRDQVLYRRLKKTSLFLTLLFFTLAPPWEVPAAITGHHNQLLQFTNEGHVLGFQPDGLYVATGRHMLHIGFLEMAGVPPQVSDATARPGKARPLPRISYTNLWPGINLRYTSFPGGIFQSTWEIAAGADVNLIRLRYSAPLAITGDGSLKIDLPNGWMRESPPVAWQVIDGRRHQVAVAFRLMPAPENKPVVGFNVGEHNPAYPLMIDPVLSWNTFMGSANTEYAFAMAMDNSGNIYVTGRGNATWGAPVRPYAGGVLMDAFAAKIDNSGVLQWNTFLGSAGIDSGEGIAVDDSGNVYVCGYSDATWGSPVGPHAIGPNNDAFAAKLDANGNLLWNTFMGSNDDETATAVAVDGSGNVYLAGSSGASWGSPLAPYTGNDDVFVSKLNSSGTRVWHTFMGSAATDWGEAIEVDGDGNIYVAGESGSTWGTPKNPHTNLLDAFAARLNNSGSLQWNTFMGSTDNDYSQDLAIDGDGNVYVGGYAHGTWGTPNNAYQGSSDSFAAKLDGTTGVLVWNTFLGSAVSDTGGGITVDSAGNVYIAGQSDASWGEPATPYAGGVSDAFAAKLDKNGMLTWNTFLGSTELDAGRGVAVDSTGAIYLAGFSTASWGEPVNPFSDFTDAFAARLSPEKGCIFFIIKSAGGTVIPFCL